MDLVTLIMTKIEWIDEPVRVLDHITKRSFVAKCQSRYLNSRKNSLTNESCVVLLNFAENYSLRSRMKFIAIIKISSNVIFILLWFINCEIAN